MLSWHPYLMIDHVPSSHLDQLYPFSIWLLGPRSSIIDDICLIDRHARPLLLESDSPWLPTSFPILIPNEGSFRNLICISRDVRTALKKVVSFGRAYAQERIIEEKPSART